MAEHKWVDSSQPQTLQGAVIFSYVNAGLGLLYLLITGAPYYLLLILLGAAALGIANELRWAYYAAVGLASLNIFVLLITLFYGSGFLGLLSLHFAGVLFALLVHPMSRQYQRIWFH